MKVKELYVEAKRSKNFQTFTVGQTITLEEGDDPEAVLVKAQHEVNNRAKWLLEDVK